MSVNLHVRTQRSTGIPDVGAVARFRAQMDALPPAPFLPPRPSNGPIENAVPRVFEHVQSACEALPFRTGEAVKLLFALGNTVWNRRRRYREKAPERQAEKIVSGVLKEYPHLASEEKARNTNFVAGLTKFIIQEGWLPREIPGAEHAYRMEHLVQFVQANGRFPGDIPGADEHARIQEIVRYAQEKRELPPAFADRVRDIVIKNLIAERAAGVAGVQEETELLTQRSTRCVIQ